MNMNVAHKFGAGLTPWQYIVGMTRNQQNFIDWYDRFSWPSEEEEAFFYNLRGRTDMRCLILCTDWCPDVIWNVPVLFRVLDLAGIATEVLLMEQHLETMDLFLLDGGRAQPIAVFTDAEGAVLGQWGPRPKYIQLVMDQFRQENPDRQAADYQDKIKLKREEIAEMYNAGTEYQSVIVRELQSLFKGIW